MPRIQITIVPKQIGQIWDQILEDMLNDVTNKTVSYGDRPLKELISNHYYQSLNVYQGQCYMQYTSNLCGYHATFNALCCLHMYLNLKSQYNIQSGASFWKFKKKVQKFLLEIKKANNLPDKWPWRQSDILNGDFERTYNKICVQFFDDFDIFKQDHSKFTYMDFTWEFQYENLLISQENRVDLNNKIKYFQNYQGEKPLIFGIMMGITCHWTYLVAFKNNRKSEYWFFDSQNQKELEYNQEQIQKSVGKFNQQRINKKMKALTNFERENYGTLIKDTQISVKLLVNCLEGKDSIDKYAYNQLLNVFVKNIEVALQSKSQQVILTVIKDYWYNINAFFRQSIKWDLLTSHSNARMKMLFTLADELKKQGPEGKKFYDLMKRHNLPKGLF